LAQTQTVLNVTQEKLPHSQIGLQIEISGERSQQAYDKVITDLMRTAQIPGFRRGKTPRQVILQRFGADYLKASTLDSLVQSSLDQAIKQEKLEILGNLQLRSDIEELVAAFQPGQTLTFSASADVAPEVTLNKYKDFQLTVERTLYDPQRVDKTLEQQQSQHATLVPIEDRAAMGGDAVMVDFTTKILGSEDEFEPTDSEQDSETDAAMTDFQVELQEDRFLPEFVHQVIGMTIGETKDFEITFPEDYFSADFAGQQVAFHVTLKEIKAKELPDLSDDFAQEISEFPTLEELRTFLTEQYQSEAESQTQGQVQDALVNALVEEMEVDLPQTMIDQEVSVLLNEMAMRFQSQGFDVNKIFTRDSIPGFQQRLRPDAQDRIKRTLALAEVAKAEKIQVEAETLESRFTETLEEFGQTKIDRDRLREVITDQVLQETVLEWLEKHSQITLVDPSPETESEQGANEEADKKPEKASKASKAVEETETKPKAKTTKTPKEKTEPKADTTAEKESAEKPAAAKTPRKRPSTKAKEAKDE
jgi:trigger factor